MLKLRLIMALMIVVALVIVAMAVYVFTGFSSKDAARSLILIAAGVVGIIIITAILLIIYKSNKFRK
jgi:hypothetical protein